MPSNIILHRVGARRWIARIMVSWGVISVAMMFVQTPMSFYVLRILLGVAEAGFLPGVIYYLGLWYPGEQRARAIAAFMMGIPVAGLVGGLLSGAIGAVTSVAMLWNSAHSDRSGERPLHVAIPNLIMGLGFLGCALLPTPALAILSLALVPIGHAAAYGPFWSMPSRFLTGQAAAGGIALVATIVNIGGFIGPTLIGVLKDRTGTHTTAFLLVGGFAIVSSLLALQLRGATALRKDVPSAAR